MPELLERLRDLLSEAREVPTALPPEDRQLIAELLEEATEAEVADISEAVNNLLQDQPGNPRVQYAQAMADEALGDTDSAANLYLQLAQHLASQRDWPGVLDLCLQAMPLSGDYRLVRLVRRAGEKGDLDTTTAMAVARQECAAAPDLLWERSQAEAAAGHAAHAVELALQALKGYVALREPEHAEDPLLAVLESADPEVYERLLDIVRSMARHGQRDLLATLLDLAADTFVGLGMGPQLADTLGAILRQEPECALVRPFWARAVTQPHAYSETLSELVKASGLDDPQRPLDDALDAFHEAVVFSPGAYVGHRTWGVGIVRANEDEELVVDFPEKPRHHMAVAMGRQVLTPLAPDSLLVRRATAFDELKQEADRDPAGIVCRLLAESGGEIVTADVKLRLVDWLVPEESWSAWWKKARKALEADPRVDCSQAFRQLYRWAAEGHEAAVPLPSLDPRKGIKGAVSLVTRLLQQHPDLGIRARAYYGPELEIMLRNTPKGSDWVRALPLLIKWYPDREREWVKAAEQYANEASLTLGWTAEDQEAVLEVALRGRAWKDAAFQALTSRFEPVHDRGLQALRERCGAQFWDDVNDLLLSGGHYAEKMALADMALAGEITRDGLSPDELPVEPWFLFHAALSVVSARGTHAGRGTANRLLRASGPLTRFLKGRDLPEAAGDLFATFRRRPVEGEVQIPILALLQEVGQEALADEVLRFRRAVVVEDDRLPPELDPRVTLMTRRTFEAQSERLRDMAHQLADQIPKEIAKARSLGDLAENAEYHAARERQGIIKALHDSLSAQMEGAFIIEDIHRNPGVVGVGKELRLRELESGAEQTVWVLGEGDSQYGHEVVSYKAPLGHALVGKKPGDVVQVGEDGPRYEVLSITDKLPD
jgi:transcription elongation factor GreA